MSQPPKYRRRATDAVGLTRQQIFERRAAMLAKPPPAPGATQGLLEIVEFRVGAERYAIETTWVREVYHARAITIVPGTPEFVLGIINVQGRIISVIDIRSFFGLRGREASEEIRVLILRSDEMEFAVLADEIVGVSRIAPGELQATLPTLQGSRIEYLKGITNDRMTVLDAGKMLADPGLVVDEEVQA
ncbi:MAG TPA: chemotaxis protein CheW [Candidatus Deferrimicrobiaceae bacterium]